MEQSREINPLKLNRFFFASRKVLYVLDVLYILNFYSTPVPFKLSLLK